MPVRPRLAVLLAATAVTVSSCSSSSQHNDTTSPPPTTATSGAATSSPATSGTATAGGFNPCSYLTPRQIIAASGLSGPLTATTSRAVGQLTSCSFDDSSFNQHAEITAGAASRSYFDQLTTALNATHCPQVAGLGDVAYHCSTGLWVFAGGAIVYAEVRNEGWSDATTFAHEKDLATSVLAKR